MKSKITRIAIITLCMLSFSISPFSAMAATYETWSARGIKYLAYTKDTVTWSTNSKKIKSYDADQSRSGLFVQNKGCKKESSRSTQTTFSIKCKHTFLVGAVVGGVTLGWNDDINDRVYIYRSGSVSWYHDI